MSQIRWEVMIRDILRSQLQNQDEVPGQGHHKDSVGCEGRLGREGPNQIATGSITVRSLQIEFEL